MTNAMTLRKRILKKTRWYEMYAEGEQELKPQIDEGITDIKWFKEKKVKKALKNTYRSIKVTVKDYLGS